MRRTVKKRRVVASGTRHEVGPREDSSSLDLDDRPLALRTDAAQKRLFVAMPYEVWIVDAKSLAYQRNVELPMEAPRLALDEGGTLWIGGPHLHRGSEMGGRASKVGAKLGGWVEHVVPLRRDLLCGVGHSGEVLIEPGDPVREVHRRKRGGGPPTDLVATVDGRAIFADGSATAWIVDPAHPEGYTQLRMKRSSSGEVESEGIVKLGRARSGRVLLAARDGAVAWTRPADPSLRLEAERFVDSGRGYRAQPLDVVGDERWVYVLRPRGILQRFLIEQPPEVREAEAQRQKRKGKGGRQASSPPPEAPDPLPSAQQVRLPRIASCLCLLDQEGTKLVLAGARAEGQLGTLWACDPESLEWEDVALDERPVREEAPSESAARVPDFTQTRTKIEGPPLRGLSVDEVIAGRQAWLLATSGALLDRATCRLDGDSTLAGDLVLVPAMIRAHAGLARPALMLWPGQAREDRPTPELAWVAWGDRPRGWMALATPQIREQKWTRSEVFPLTVALGVDPGELPGQRARVPKRWFDRALFEAMVKECKAQLKVLW